MSNTSTLTATIQNAKIIENPLVENANGLGLSIQANEKVSKPKKEKKPLYLVEGIKGKQLVGSKISTNNAIKADRKSISSAIRDILKHNTGFLESFANYNVNDIKPTNLTPLLKENEGKNGFSCWLVMQLITRYYKNI